MQQRNRFHIYGKFQLSVESEYPSGIISVKYKYKHVISREERKELKIEKGKIKI